jgi:uncharacterized membrane protein YeaQ/YmgE (transglycosylase-associated protein family)
MEEVVSNDPGLFAGLIIIAVVGAVIGWLASLIVKGSRFGLWGNMLIGFGGSAIGSSLLPALGLLVLSRFSSGLFRAMFAMKEIENGKEIHRRVSV